MLSNYLCGDIFHVAAESRPGITGPWRLVSYFEIRLVICLLSKVTGLSLGKLRYRIFVDGATGHWPMAMCTLVGD